nr:unnamed protein product [Naegleria fowleri]
MQGIHHHVSSSRSVRLRMTFRYLDRSRTCLSSFLLLLLIFLISSSTSLQASSFSPLHRFIGCSYEQIIGGNNNGNNGSSFITQRINITDDFSDFTDVPFGFGCYEILFPTDISSYPFSTSNMEQGLHDIYSPVQASSRMMNLCSMFPENTSCIETFCGPGNSNQGLQDQDLYRLVNFCQYCKKAKDFVQFHKLVAGFENYDNSSLTACPAFKKFPSAFLCRNVQIGLPIFFMDRYFKRLRTPFMCYCHKYDQYSTTCDNSLLFTLSFDNAKLGILLALSAPLFIAIISLIVLPECFSFRYQKPTPLSIQSIIFMTASAVCIVVASGLSYVPSFNDSNNLMYLLENLSLSLNVFFTYYTIIPVLLMFDRVYMYLKTGEKNNWPVFKLLSYISVTVNTLCMIYIVSALSYQISTHTMNVDQSMRIILGLGYVAYALPWFCNLILFLLVAFKLGCALKEMTNVLFFKTKYFYQFMLLNALTLLALLSCLLGFLYTQFGISSTDFIISYYTEFAAHCFSISSLLAIVMILFDKEKFLDCYPCLKRVSICRSRGDDEEMSSSLIANTSGSGNSKMQPSEGSAGMSDLTTPYNSVVTDYKSLNSGESTNVSM